MKTKEALDMAIRLLQGRVQGHSSKLGVDREHLALQVLENLRDTLVEGGQITFHGDIVYSQSGHTDSFEQDELRLRDDDHHVGGHPL